MSKMYRSLKDLPSHKKGDILIEKEDHYIWSSNPFFTMSKSEVENYNEWFELVIDDWSNEETFYYLSSNFEIIEAQFNAFQHHRLVLSGNAFKDKESIEWFKDNIEKLLKDDVIITDNNTIKKIISLIKSNNNSAIEILMNML